jgi:hypothetical protein
MQLLYSLAPESKFMALFEAIVKDVWKRKQSDREETTAQLLKKLEAAEARKQKLLDLLLKGTIDDATYKQDVESWNRND